MSIAFFVVLTAPLTLAATSGDPCGLTGQAYVAAQQAQAQSPAETAAAPSWSDAQWRTELCREAAALWRSSPELMTRFNALDGLDPSKYSKRRRPDPEVGRELVRKALPAVALADALISRREEALFPRGGRESEALVDGLIVALGESEHPVVAPVLAAIATDTERTIAVRALALSHLGHQSRAARAQDLLHDVVSDAAQPTRLRIGAAVGLSRIRNAASVQTLHNVVQTAGTNTDLARAGIRALGSVGSTWARSTEPAVRESAAVHLATWLCDDNMKEHEDVLIDALGTAAHATMLPVLNAHGARDGAAARIARAKVRLRRAGIH